MNEQAFDRTLYIKTAGTLQGLNQSVHYNRYEATPYEALEELFRRYSPKRTDRLVDFGSGKGRLPFYINHYLGLSAVGVEMNSSLYQEALINQASYMERSKRLTGTVQFERCLAEEYKVEKDETIFYFFNPFSVQIFRKVVNNIMRSVEVWERQTDLILYFPTADYVRFLEEETVFELLMEVQVPGLYEQNNNERFLIYRQG